MSCRLGKRKNTKTSTMPYQEKERPSNWEANRDYKIKIDNFEGPDNCPAPAGSIEVLQRGLSQTKLQSTQPSLSSVITQNINIPPSITLRNSFVGNDSKDPNTEVLKSPNIFRESQIHEILGDQVDACQSFNAQLLKKSEDIIERM